jgi:hypothetical protein
VPNHLLTFTPIPLALQSEGNTPHVLLYSTHPALDVAESPPVTSILSVCPGQVKLPPASANLLVSVCARTRPGERLSHRVQPTAKLPCCGQLDALAALWRSLGTRSRGPAQWCTVRPWVVGCFRPMDCLFPFLFSEWIQIDSV